LEIIDNQRFRDSDRTQKSLLSTWLIEIHLNDLNNCVDSTQNNLIRNDLLRLMREKKDYLDTVKLKLTIRARYINFYNITAVLRNSLNSLRLKKITKQLSFTI
jgi:hypothetical protein